MRTAHFLPYGWGLCPGVLCPWGSLSGKPPPPVDRQTPVKQECIPVGCVPPACCPYLPDLPACTALGGVSAWGGVPARGVYLPEWGTCWGVYLPRGCTCPGVYLPRGVPAWGVPAQVLSPLWTEWQTGAKILPGPKLRLRAVKIYYYHIGSNVSASELVLSHYDV